MVSPEDDENDQSDANARLKEIIELSADIAGGAIGGALGFLAAGPAGAAIFGAGGAAAATALRRAGQEIADRWLSPREEARVGAVVALAANSVQTRISEGEKPREDDFFSASEGSRSAADETTEALLLKAQRESEEKKIPYLANLLSQSVFYKELSRELLHQILKIVDSLTYRQLAILMVLSGNYSQQLRKENYSKEGQIPNTKLQVIYECFDLYNRGLLNNGGAAALGVGDIVPSKMRTQGLGNIMIQALGLHQIPDSDLAPVIAQLAD